MAKKRARKVVKKAQRTAKRVGAVKRRLPAAAAYLKKLSTAVRAHFAAAMDVPTFLATAGPLSGDQQRRIVEQSLVLLEQNYVHLPLKRAMHAVEPIQRLKLLLQRLEQSPSLPLGDTQFHREMTEIFTSVRDLHTNYLLPSPFSQMVAFLPFMVEDYFEQGQRKYLVSHIAGGFEHPTFVPGVEIVYWNGMPIERAVWNNAHRHAGSNLEARQARGVQMLTSRPLRMALPPDEQWVVVGYRTAGGELEEHRFDWMVNPPLPAGEGVEAPAEAEIEDVKLAAAMGMDLEQDLIQRIRKALFAPQMVAAARKAAEKTAKKAAFGDLETAFPDVFQARPVTTPHGTFGYLRIRTFSVRNVPGFVNEFIRLITALPQNGLILDVRGNGGGVIMNGELILQTFTARRIEPEPFQFINTPVNLAICRRNSPGTGIDLSPWVRSMEQALQTAAIYSAGFPISSPEACNAIGQKYFGPVLLITDALCYSTTDIFAAGFQDHQIGPVLGTDDNTGAGGANVWMHGLLRDLLPGAGSPYQPLPNQAGMRVSMRRCLRVGPLAGTPLEDLGVVPDDRHFMTRDDLLNGNVDLINKAASMLAQLPVRGLTVTVQPASPALANVTAESQGINRLDIYVNDRPVQSLDLQGNLTTFSIPRPDTPRAMLEVQGFDGAELVARYRTEIALET